MRAFLMYVCYVRKNLEDISKRPLHILPSPLPEHAVKSSSLPLLLSDRLLESAGRTMCQFYSCTALSLCCLIRLACSAACKASFQPCVAHFVYMARCRPHLLFGDTSSLLPPQSLCLRKGFIRRIFLSLIALSGFFYRRGAAVA